MAILKIVAGTTAPVCADPAEEFFKQHDPALRAVDAHRRAARIFNEAVRVEFASYGKVTEAAYARLNEITRARRMIVSPQATHWSKHSRPQC